MATNPTFTELGPLLKQARERAGLNQRDAAQFFNVTNPTISSWELGTSIPSFDQELLDKMTQFLEIEPEQMAALIVQSIVAWNTRRANR